MDKYVYLLKALKANNYLELQWLYSILSLSEHLKGVNYPYPCLRDLNGYYTLEGTSSNKIYLTEDNKPCDIRLPLFNLADNLTLNKDDIPNVFEPVETRVGLVLLNMILIVYPFNNKIPYVNNGKIKSIISDNIAKRLMDDNDNNPDGITMDEYFKCLNAANDFLPALNPVVAVTATKKTLTRPPGMIETRDKLIEQYKNEGKDLNDPLVYKEIENALEKLAKDYLSDDPAYGNFLSGKVWNIAYKKTVLAKGLEPNFDDGTAPPILQSLSEGVDLSSETLIAENNSIRVGSYSRAKETVKGGTLGKWIMRFLSMLKIIPGDCGTKKGVKRVYFKSASSAFKDNKVLSGNTWVHTNKLSLEEGKVYTVRSLAYCELENPFHRCTECAGEHLAANPDSLLNAGTELSFAILNAALKKMHSTGIINLSTIHLNKLLT